MTPPMTPRDLDLLTEQVLARIPYVESGVYDRKITVRYPTLQQAIRIGIEIARRNPLVLGRAE